MAKGEMERRQIQDVCCNKSLREVDELEVQPKEKTNRQKSAEVFFACPDGWQYQCHPCGAVLKRRPSGLESWFYHLTLFDLYEYELVT